MNSEIKADKDEDNLTNKKIKYNKDEDCFDFEDPDFRIFWQAISSNFKDIYNTDWIFAHPQIKINLLDIFFKKKFDDELLEIHKYIVKTCSTNEDVTYSKEDQGKYQQFMIGYMKYIQNLKLKLPGMKHIPRHIKFLSNCCVLEIEGPSFLDLPKEIGKLEQLQILSVKYTNISLLPSSIGNLKKLMKLQARNNQFKDIPEIIRKLTNLEYLDLSNNAIRSLPSFIGDLYKLKRLELSNNELKCVPQELGHLTNLIKLYLNDNYIERLPSSIGKLTNMRYLFLQHNKLILIPHQISNCKSCYVMNLNDNNLLSLPREIINMHSLSDFEFSENPIYQRLNIDKNVHFILYNRNFKNNKKLLNIFENMTPWSIKRLMFLGHKDPDNLFYKLPIELLRKISFMMS